MEDAAAALLGERRREACVPGRILMGAGRGDRTLTGRSPRVFETRASADSAIPACARGKRTGRAVSPRSSRPRRLVATGCGATTARPRRDHGVAIVVDGADPGRVVRS